MGQDGMDLVVGDRALEPGHIVFSVGDDLGEFSLRLTLDIRLAQVGHVQALPYRGATAVWPVAGLAFRFVHTCAGRTVLTGRWVRSQHDNNKKTGGERQKAGKMQFPGVQFHSPPKFPNLSRDLLPLGPL